jgi:hypothetical protein
MAARRHDRAFPEKSLRAVKRAFESISEWIDRLFAPRDPAHRARAPPAPGGIASSHIFMIALTLVLAVAALALIAQGVATLARA